MPVSECKKYRGRLVDLFYGELRGDLLEATKGHLKNCPACQEEYRELKALSKAVDSVAVPAVAQEDISRVIDLVSREEPWHERLWNLLKYNLAPIERMFLPGLLSVLVCFLTLAPIVFSDAGKYISPMALLVCGVLWSSIYNSIIGAIIESSRHREGVIRLRVVIYGVLVSILFMHFFYFAGFKSSLLSSDLASSFLLKLPGSLTLCSALALLVVGMALGLLLKRRSFPHLLLILTLYLAINLPGFSVFSRLQFSLYTLLAYSFPVVLAAVLGLCLGKVLKELDEKRKAVKEPKVPLRQRTAGSAGS